MMRKRALTLIEVVISLSLLTLLLGVLFSSYGSLMTEGAMIEKKREEVFGVRYLELRLNTLFSKICWSKEKDGNVLYTERIPAGPYESLLFAFENGDDTDEHFCNKNLGRLFVDHEGRLILASWPKPKSEEDYKKEMRLEVLAEGVEDLKFSFYVPHDLKKVVESEGIRDNEGSEPPRIGWIEYWNLAWHRIPPMIRVNFSHHGNGREFYFFVNKHDYPLNYTDSEVAG